MKVIVYCRTSRVTCTTRVIEQETGINFVNRRIHISANRALKCSTIVRLAQYHNSVPLQRTHLSTAAATIKQPVYSAPK